MTTRRRFTYPVSSMLTLGLAFLLPAPVFAHCDGLDGPVVKAAQLALDTGNPAPVLIWVPAKDEPEIRAAFERTLAVRALNRNAKALADRFFFETVVRVHRAGEGEPFTGLKEAGRDLGPAIPAADKAIDEESAEPVVKLLIETVRHRVIERFNDVVAANTFRADDIGAGRRYVETYVDFIQYVERLYDSSITSPQGHYGKSATAAHNR